MEQIQDICVLEHFPYCIEPGRETAGIVGSGSPGQMVSLSFSLLAAASHPEVRLKTAELRNSSGCIAVDCLDLHVVHVWPQAGIGVYQSPDCAVGELLLKDDSQPLKDSYRRIVRTWRQMLRPAYVYEPPKARLDGDVSTSLDAAKAKQFWLTIRIPQKTLSGQYGGHVRIEIGGSSGRILSLPVTLTVFPIVLLEPMQDPFLWYRGSLDPEQPQHYVDENTYRAHLKDIYAHGFRSISLFEFRRKPLQRALDIAHASGFRRNAVVMTPGDMAAFRPDFHDMRPLYYLSDEIDVRGAPHVENHIANWQRVRSGGPNLTMASLRQRSFERRFNDPADIGHRPDVLSFYLPDNLPYFLARSEFPQYRTAPVYFHWTAHMEKPNLHRVLAGLFLWKSRADGIAPYCYQHLPQHPNSPFNDFDFWDAGTPADTRAFKDHCATYPAQGGSIPTVQWKGLSEGLWDLRYLTTLESALAKAAKGAGQAMEYAVNARSHVTAFLSRIQIQAISINDDVRREPYDSIRPQEYHRFREQIAADIMVLQELTNAT